MKKIPLKNLSARWSEGSKPERPIGLAFLCPVCQKFEHEIELPLGHSPRWGKLPLFRYSEADSLSTVSLFPTVIGERFHASCTFKGWVKLGHVEYLDLESRPIKARWENSEFY